MATPPSTPERAALGRRLKARAYGLLPLPLLRRLMPRPVLGLHYHVVSDRDLPHVRHLYAYKTPAQFEADLAYLSAEFRLLSHAQLEALLRGGDEGGDEGSTRGAGAPGVFVSFDDGYRECFTVARPLLLKHAVPCTFFVTTGWLDNRAVFYRNLVSLCLDRLGAVGGEEAQAVAEALRAQGLPIDDVQGLRSWLRSLDREDARLNGVCRRLGVEPDAFLREQRPYLTRDEVRTLHREGFTIGAHTVTHPVLGRLAEWDQIRAEIVRSCRDVQQLTGAERVPFAFPLNGAGVSRDRLAALRREHPEVGLIFDTGRLQRDRDFIVHRIPAERPGPLPGPATNLPYHLRRAYINQGASVLRARFRGRRAS